MNWLPLTHFFQCLAHLFTDSSVIIFCKSDTYSSDHQRFFQDTEACIIIFHILDNRFFMCGNCIYISFSQKRIDQFSVAKADQIPQFWDSLIRPLQKDTFRFGCGLDGKILSFQITQFIDVTALIYGPL